MNGKITFRHNGDELGWMYVTDELVRRIVESMKKSKVDVEFSYYEPSECYSVDDLIRGLSNGGDRSISFTIIKKEVK